MPEEVRSRFGEKSYGPLNAAKAACVQEPRHVMIPVSKPTVRTAQPAQAPVCLRLSAAVGGRPCLPSFGGLHTPRGPTI